MLRGHSSGRCWRGSCIEELRPPAANHVGHLAWEQVLQSQANLQMAALADMQTAASGGTLPRRPRSHS